MNNSNPPPTDAIPAEPTRIGHYELRDCIGRGGMGLVYRARDTRLDRQVAIKCLRTELFEAHYVERFKREALLLAKLNHPNIVQIYDFIEAPDQIALVMELVEGQNLQLHLREHIVPFAQRMRWLTEIAQGLAVAHDTGIIHRDLKAENILINQRKVAKITDLGIAKSQDFNATLTDHIAGSYCSMSPEQAMGEPLDFKSDLFSFGILAYQLLCGAHPFGDTNNKLQLMQRIISHPPIAPGKHNPDLPPEINDLLGQLLSKDPDKRPDNTHWVAAQLEKLSHLQLANDFVSDDTQALIPSGNTINQSNVKNTGINSAVRTQDHPTFETRFVPVNTAPKKSRWLPIKNYLIENQISVGLGLFSILIITAAVIWQLQPKPPKYVAVVPPQLTAEGMQNSQQELVKEAVYDAIQQGIIQLDNYFLIPRDEVSSISGSIETIRSATAADELITAEIKCISEACSVTLTKLTAATKASRANVSNTKTIDILADSYLSAANVIQDATIKLYQTKETAKKISSVTEEDYTTFLTTNKNYRSTGATANLLEKLDQLGNSTKSMLAVQSLYREIALDLFHETGNETYLSKLEKFIDFYNSKDEIHYLYNLHILKITQGKLDEAIKLSDRLSTLGIGNAALNEINAHIMMKKNNYEKAIHFYAEALKTKTTANNFFNIGNAYWYSGNTNLAKKFLNDSLTLAPNFYKSLTVYGQIALIEGDIATAKVAFEKAIKHKPDDIINTTNLGLTHLLSGQYEESEKLFTHAYSLAQNQSTLMLNIADSQNLAGEPQKANESYLAIINSEKFKSKTNENLRNKSQSYAHLGDISKALTTLQQLEQSDPQNIETKYTAALVHTLAKNTASAVLNIENVLSGGMSYIWFNFPWFDNLCANEKFIRLMKENGAPSRCPSDIRSQGVQE